MIGILMLRMVVMMVVMMMMVMVMMMMVVVLMIMMVVVGGVDDSRGWSYYSKERMSGSVDGGVDILAAVGQQESRHNFSDN